MVRTNTVRHVTKRQSVIKSKPSTLRLGRNFQDHDGGRTSSKPSLIEVEKTEKGAGFLSIWNAIESLFTSAPLGPSLRPEPQSPQPQRSLKSAFPKVHDRPRDHKLLKHPKFAGIQPKAYFYRLPPVPKYAAELLGDPRDASNEYDSIERLQSILGFQGDADHEVILLAIDTEFQEISRLGVPLRSVVEVGITTLAVRDIVGIQPGPLCERWLSKARHHHLVVDVAGKQDKRMWSFLFGQTEIVSRSDARERVLDILQSISPAVGNKIAIIGQSPFGDIEALGQRSGLAMDLMRVIRSRYDLTAAFDTHLIAIGSRRLGAKFENLQLGTLVRDLGVHPKYRDAKGDVVGLHNAGNDAAYSLMALLLFATRWNDITQTKYKVIVRIPSTKQPREVAKSSLVSNLDQRRRSLAKDTMKTVQPHDHRNQTLQVRQVYQKSPSPSPSRSAPPATLGRSKGRPSNGVGGLVAQQSSQAKAVLGRVKKRNRSKRRASAVDSARG